MNHTPTVVVTGSSGFIGQALVSYFLDHGYRVRAFQRNLPTHPHPEVEYYIFNLKNIEDYGLSGADYLVHCAYHTGVTGEDFKSDIDTNLSAAKKIIDLCKKHHIKKVFLSTLSAHPEAESYYGKNKLATEKLFDAGQDLILKPGLVLGNGGLFGRIAVILKNKKIIPLIGGKRKIQIIALDDLCAVIRDGLEKNITGIYAIAHPEEITMERLYRSIALHVGSNPIFIPFPLGIAYEIAILAEHLGLHFPITSENVLGLKHLKTFDTAHDVDTFGITIKNFQKALEQLNTY